MPSLTILKAGLMTSIQDMGRKGLAYYAIPNSGVMDKKSARQALFFLNQTEKHPLIECTSIAPHIKFNDATQIALSGADFDWALNKKQLTTNGVYEVKKGDILKGKFAKNGLRAYIAINGNLKLERVYNSYSTYTNAQIGGLEGQLLKAGDTLEWENTTRVLGKSTQENLVFKEQIIRIHRGPEFSYLSPAAQKILTSTNYKISADSNRMGIRLVGEKLESSTYQLKYSLPVLPGFIQLPPSGLPIILLQDGQISGGYPRIAYVAAQFLSDLNQIPLGQVFRFSLE